MNIPLELDYDDVYLIPQKCVVSTRSECDITATLGKHTFSNPVILANMPSVVNFKTCEYLANKGMFYIMHRFVNPHELAFFIDDMRNKKHIVSISIGVKESDELIIHRLASSSLPRIPDFITIDVAHAHSDATAKMIKFIKHIMPEAFVIVGNVATAEAVEFLEKAGADATKVCIGPGAACSTRIKTGFTRGTVTCVRECASVAKKPIIADGGIEEAGHIAKAIACGATMVMSGWFMSGFDQNSGQIVIVNGEKKYIYYGSASFNVKQNNDHIEGLQILVDYKGDMTGHIYDIECSLKSSVSYAGKKRLRDIVGTPMFRVEKNRE